MAFGQFTGSREKYVYTSDDGTDYILTLDTTLAATSSTLTLFDPANPGTAIPAPRRFRPRGVHWQGTQAGYEGRRKFLVCGDPSDPHYSRASGESFTVDLIQGRTTGRRGETLSF